MTPLSSPVNILPNVTHTKATSSASKGKSKRGSAHLSSNHDAETPDIAALLKAQRARTPVAIAVTQDYSGAPFKLPRPFVVLGWFWVADAWVGLLHHTVNPMLIPTQTEPEIPDMGSFAGPSKPRWIFWKFRFEWCSGKQPTPWWSATSEPDRADGPSSPLDEAWTLSNTESNGSTTVRDAMPPGTPQSMDYIVPDSEFFCSHCKKISQRVYAKRNICLNETCVRYFHDMSARENGVNDTGTRADLVVSDLEGTTAEREHMISPAPDRIGLPNDTPGKLPLRMGILPESLGLRLRPPEPTGTLLETTRANMGREFWGAWVCKACGMANEKRRWNKWDCEACGVSTLPLVVYVVEEIL